MCCKRFWFVAVALAVLVSDKVNAGPPQPPIITSGEWIRGDFDGDGLADEARIDWVTFHVTARTTVNFNALVYESIYSGDLNGDGELTRADGGMVLLDENKNILVVHDDSADVPEDDGMYAHLDGYFDHTFVTEGTYTLAISANGYWLTGEDALAGYIDYRIVGAAFRDEDGNDLDHADWQLTLTVSEGEVSNVSVDTLGTPATPNPVDAAACTYLWPPNHELVDVGMPFDPTVDVLVYSSELDEEANEDGLADAVFDEQGALCLRAERSGEGIGRVYLITISSESGFECCTVVVPHDKSKAGMAIIEEEAVLAEASCLLTGEAPEGYSLVASSLLP